MALKQLSDGGPDGTVLGQDATDLVGFFGATPVVKQTSANFANVGTSQDVLSATISTTGGIMTSQGASAVLDVVNSLVETMNSYGLLADA